MTHAIATLIRKTTSNGHRPSGKRQRVDRTSKRDREIRKALKIELIERVAAKELDLSGASSLSTAKEELVKIVGQMLNDKQRIDPSQKLRIARKAVDSALKRHVHIVQRRRKFVACSTEDKRKYEALDALEQGASRKFEDTAYGKAVNSKEGKSAA